MLATMLEELQGAGLGWDHPYVQCRIQGSLFSLQRQQQLPPNLCANLAPAPPEFGDPASAMAYVRFTPPEPETEVEYYEQPSQAQFYPALRKKQVRENDVDDIYLNRMLQDRRPLRHDPGELEHFGKGNGHGHGQGAQMDVPSIMDTFLETERQRIEREQELRQAEQRNRLELYQILAESEPDPQPYQRKTPAPANAMDQLEALVEKQQQRELKEMKQQREQEQQEQEQAKAPVYVPPEEVNESSELYFPDNFAPFKRARGGSRGGLVEAENEQPKRSFFRELAGEQGLVQEPLLSLRHAESELDATPELAKRRPLPFSQLDPNEVDAQQQELAFESGLLRNSLTPLEEEAMLASNSFPRQTNSQRVYTEGGMLVMPDADAGMQADEPENVKQSLLANMLGFARHERLDVKKPGPLLGPPSPLGSSELSNQLETDKTGARKPDGNGNGNKEVLPAHIKGSAEDDEAHKKKKVMHSAEDHAQHTVDTEYVHVFVKNP